MDWNDLRYFLAVARSGSLTEAGKGLMASPSTVARRVAALETALGVVLFDRGRDGYVLTERGRSMVPDAEAAEARIQVLTRDAGQAPAVLAGTIRVAAPELLAQRVVVPALGAFQVLHPAIRVDIAGHARPVRLARHEADLLIRLVRPSTGSDYTMRRIGQLTIGLFAADSYLVEMGMPAAPGDMRGHRVVGWDEDLAYITVARWVDQQTAGASVALRSDGMIMHTAAAQAGIGIAALPDFVGRDAGLRPVLADQAKLVQDIWMLVHQDASGLARVTALADHLAAVFRRDPDLVAPSAEGEEAPPSVDDQLALDLEASAAEARAALAKAEAEARGNPDTGGWLGAVGDTDDGW